MEKRQLTRQQQMFLLTIFMVVVAAMILVLIRQGIFPTRSQGIPDDVQRVTPTQTPAPPPTPVSAGIQTARSLRPAAEPVLYISAGRDGPSIEVSRGYTYETAVTGVVPSRRGMVMFPLAIRIIDIEDQGCIRLVFFEDIGLGQDHTMLVVVRRRIILGPFECGTTLLSWMFPSDG